MASKMQFNKKFIIFGVIAIIIIGGGLFLYHELSSRTDVKAISNSAYEVTVSSKENSISVNLNKIESSVSDMLARLNSYDTDIKDTSKDLQTYLSETLNILKCYDKFDAYINDNILFCKASETVAKLQRKLTKQQNTLEKDVTSCVDYIKNSYEFSLSSNASQWTIYTCVDNFCVPYSEFTKSLKLYYYYISELLQHVNQTYYVNPLTKLQIKTFCDWANLSLKVTKQTINANLAGIKNLLNYFNNTVNLTTLDKYYQNIVANNNLLKKVSLISYSKLLSLANSNQVQSYINALINNELKYNTYYVAKTYLALNVAMPSEF